MEVCEREVVAQQGSDAHLFYILVKGVLSVCMGGMPVNVKWAMDRERTGEGGEGEGGVGGGGGEGGVPRTGSGAQTARERGRWGGDRDGGGASSRGGWGEGQPGVMERLCTLGPGDEFGLDEITGDERKYKVRRVWVPRGIFPEIETQTT